MALKNEGTKLGFAFRAGAVLAFVWLLVRVCIGAVNLRHELEQLGLDR